MPSKQVLLWLFLLCGLGLWMAKLEYFAQLSKRLPTEPLLAWTALMVGDVLLFTFRGS